MDVIPRNPKTRAAQLAVVCFLLGGLGPAYAEGVSVNGATASFLDLLVLVNWNCGEAIPDGDYWLDGDTGAWGYSGGPQQGRLPCHSAVASGTAEPANEEGEDQDDKSPFFEDRMCARGLCDSVIVNPVYP